ncbi:hypothetical protein GCM10025792_53700 [Pseudonocardia tropica]
MSRTGRAGWTATDSRPSLASDVRLRTRPGSRVTAEVDRPRGGPRTWSMLRPATTSGP